MLGRSRSPGCCREFTSRDFSRRRFHVTRNFVSQCGCFHSSAAAAEESAWRDICPLNHDVINESLLRPRVCVTCMQLGQNTPLQSGFHQQVKTPKSVLCVRYQTLTLNDYANRKQYRVQPDCKSQACEQLQVHSYKARTETQLITCMAVRSFNRDDTALGFLDSLSRQHQAGKFYCGRV